jgi:hypothetical protein
MTSDTQTLREDISYLRRLVDESESTPLPFARGYLAGGLCYGGQILLNVAQGFGLLPNTGGVALAIGLGPTVVFAIAMLWIVMRTRSRPGGGQISKAIGVAFGAIGFANLSLILIVGAVALREKSLLIWLIFPCCVFALQGTGWLLAYMLRRVAWHGLVAAGWFVCGIAMAIFIRDIPLFVLFAGIGLWGCMALPGFILVRQARSQ